METTQTSTIASKDSRSAWRKTDTMWMLGLYGTAIGAGVLFLPINAGVGGMIPLIIIASYCLVKTRAKTSPRL